MAWTYERNNVDITEFRKKKVKSAGRITAIAIVGLLSVLFVAGFLYLTLSLFKLEKVTVSGSERYIEQDIVDALGFSNGTNLFYLDAKKVAEDIERKFPYVETAKVKKDFPHTLAVEVTETDARFIFEGEDCCYLVSPKMKVLAEVSKMSDYYVFVDYNIEKTQVAGESFVFNKALDKTAFTAVISALESNDLMKSVTEIDFSDKFALSISYEGRITLSVGDYRQIEDSIAVCAKFLKTRTGDDRGTVFISSGNLYYEPEH